MGFSRTRLACIHGGIEGGYGKVQVQGFSVGVGIHVDHSRRGALLKRINHEIKSMCGRECEA